MSTISKVVSPGIASLLLTVGIFLIYQRGGILAWLALLIGTALLIKFWLRPTHWDLQVTIGLAAVWLLSWPAVFYYVISTWETGEVIELAIKTSQADHSARTWILEDLDSSILYYDAPAVPATALLSGAEIEVLRGGQPLSIDTYVATRVDDMPDEQVDRLFGLMAEKYGDRNAATDIYYAFLGRSVHRVGVVIELKGLEGH